MTQTAEAWEALQARLDTAQARLGELERQRGQAALEGDTDAVARLREEHSAAVASAEDIALALKAEAERLEAERVAAEAAELEKRRKKARGIQTKAVATARKLQQALEAVAAHAAELETLHRDYLKTLPHAPRVNDSKLSRQSLDHRLCTAFCSAGLGRLLDANYRGGYDLGVKYPSLPDAEQAAFEKTEADAAQKALDAADAASGPRKRAVPERKHNGSMSDAV